MLPQYPGFVISKRGCIRTIRISVPERKNALRKQMFHDFVRALSDASTDPDTIITVVTGTGDYFSSGNDLRNFEEALQSGKDVHEIAPEVGEMFRSFVEAFLDYPKILIAAVNGHAVGVAVTILPLFDMVFAVENANFRTPFVQLGQSPEGCSSYTFPRLLGFGKTFELFCQDKVLSSEEAEKYGLVTKTFRKMDFQTRVEQELAHLSFLPKESLFSCKRLLRHWDRDSLRKVNNEEVKVLLERIQSSDCIEAVVKFISTKRHKAKL